MKSVSQIASPGHGGIVQRSKWMSQPRGMTIIPIESPGAEIRGTMYEMIRVLPEVGKGVARGDRGSE